ncbi:hypothetical protein B0T17DRAFT_617304 [Bombardia bombarda]|uniref:Uncharacterized protein n=1 Tax=Bombardia bombarda TaxID=252184 RepID=A0AA39X1D3_9PEZI|nr:hypothetical protein B0T17DRAFT_617304 [Bombardia bombarda]
MFLTWNPPSEWLTDGYETFNGRRIFIQDIELLRGALCDDLGFTTLGDLDDFCDSPGVAPYFEEFRVDFLENIDAGWDTQPTFEDIHLVLQPDMNSAMTTVRRSPYLLQASRLNKSRWTPAVHYAHFILAVYCHARNEDVRSPWAGWEEELPRPFQLLAMLCWYLIDRWMRREGLRVGNIPRIPNFDF